MAAPHERRLELQKPAQAVLADEPDDLLVVERGSRVEAVRALGIMGVAVVGARDQRDPFARLPGSAGDGAACADVLVERAVAAQG